MQDLSGLLTPSTSFRRDQTVSLLLEATALAYGLDTLRVGTKGFMAGKTPTYAELGFQDTISLETSRAAVRVTNDRLMRKSHLEVAGVRVPPSRRFGHRKTDEDEAVEYAARFRRGVLVKPRLVATGRVRRRALTEPEAIRDSFSSWRKTAGNRATFMVERRMFGSEYVFYVVGGQVVSIARVRQGTWIEEIYRHGPGGFGTIDPEVFAHVIRAFTALPGMPHGEVRVICPGDHIDSNRCAVVSVTPQVGLLRLGQPDEWSAHLAERMIAHAVRDLGLQMSDPTAKLTADFTMNEVTDSVALEQGIRQWFNEFEIEGSVGVCDREVKGTLTATPGLAATFSGMSQAGKFSKSRPQSTALVQSVGRS